MSNTSTSRALAIVAVAVVASCRSPTTPGEVTRVERVELIAPRTMAPGTTAQLRLVARRSDGSIEDVTSRSIFDSHAHEVVAVSRGGLATALKVGDSTLSAATGQLYSVHEVVVVPEGTFRLEGQVVEEGSPLGVGGVSVDIENGALRDTTNYEGRYRLYGVPANATLRISKTGYATKTLTVALFEHQTQNISIALDGARADAAGIYQLTFEAAPACRDQLPEGLQTRHYTAAISQIGSDVQATVTGAKFWDEYSRNTRDRTIIPGRHEQRSLILNLWWPSHCEHTEPDARIIEVVGDASTLEIHGTVRLLPNGPNYTGTLDGWFQVFSPPSCAANTKQLAACRSSSHRVTLTR